LTNLSVAAVVPAQTAYHQTISQSMAVLTATIKSQAL